MSIRWLWLDHFPPGMELSEAQKAQAKKLAKEHRLKERNYRGSSRQTRRWVTVISVPLSIAFTFWIIVLIGLKLTPTWHSITNVAGMMLFQGSLWATIAFTMHLTYRPYIRKALCDMGLPVCLECGYILTGIAADALCPECGTEREAASLKHDARAGAEP